VFAHSNPFPTSDDAELSTLLIVRILKPPWSRIR
jgi:hypothetical protein